MTMKRKDNKIKQAVPLVFWALESVKSEIDKHWILEEN